MLVWPAASLLDCHFPSSLHADILEAVGLDLADAAAAGKAAKRDPQFRRRVLTA